MKESVDKAKKIISDIELSKFFELDDQGRIDLLEENEFVRELFIDSKPFSYSNLHGEELSLVNFLVEKEVCANLAKSGRHRRPDWERGWGEVRAATNQLGISVRSLTPTDIKSSRPLRIYGQYANSDYEFFERDLLVKSKLMFVYKWAKELKRFHEFGCGTGHNLFLLSKAFAGEKFFGYDWSTEAVDLVKSFDGGGKFNAFEFDFFSPRADIELDSSDCVLTFAALEQVGAEWEKFLIFLLSRRPGIVLQMEPWLEGYSLNSNFDQAAISYHRKRGYLSGYFPRLKSLESEGIIKILFHKRLFIGSLFHEATTFLAWMPTVAE